MKAKKLLRELQGYIDKFWDIEVNIRINDWDFRYEENNTVSELCIEDNTHDKRLKQETTLIIK